ncbi:MAG: M1 family metallopeptidase [Ruminococcaceae bacterium]|nr:M1 family metallopeptidase [Oscillospiraceae bacterium]
MKKLLICLISVMIVCLSSCGIFISPETGNHTETYGVPGTVSTGVTDTYENGGTADEGKTREHETPPDFRKGYITKELTYIETEYVIYEIDPDIYVVEDLAEMTDKICRAIERVSGLSFNRYTDEKICVKVDKRSVTDPDAEHTTVSPHSVAGAYTTKRGDKCRHFVFITPDKLLLSGSSTLLHELAHALRFGQIDSRAVLYFNSTLDEGFATYIEINTLKYLEANDPELAYYLNTHAGTLYDIYPGKRIISKDLMYYMKNRLFSEGNDNYTVGYMFMTYLEKTYGDPYKWFTRYGDKEISSDIYRLSSTEKWINETFTEEYGAGCIENFYDWVKDNEALFPKVAKLNPAHLVRSNYVFDLTGCDRINIYPYMGMLFQETNIADFEFKYKDLYINIDEARRYLSEYKDWNVDYLSVVASKESVIKLFDENGYLIDTVVGKKAYLEGVSYIKLEGEGSIEVLELTGYYKKGGEVTEPVVLSSGTIKGGSDKNCYPDTGRIREVPRNDCDIIVKCSAPCTVTITSDTCERRTIVNTAELRVSSCRNIQIKNDTKNGSASVDYEIIAVPTEDPSF